MYLGNLLSRESFVTSRPSDVSHVISAAHHVLNFATVLARRAVHPNRAVLHAQQVVFFELRQQRLVRIEGVKMLTCSSAPVHAAVLLARSRNCYYLKIEINVSERYCMST